MDCVFQSILVAALLPRNCRFSALSRRPRIDVTTIVIVMLQKTRILVLCTGNSARSQMAEGLLRSLDSNLEVHSAGTQPAPEVHPAAIQVMKEIGLDISSSRPKAVSQFLKDSFDYVITVCHDADQNCPVLHRLT